MASCTGSGVGTQVTSCVPARGPLCQRCLRSRVRRAPTRCPLPTVVHRRPRSGPVVHSSGRLACRTGSGRRHARWCETDAAPCCGPAGRWLQRRRHPSPALGVLTLSAVAPTWRAHRRPRRRHTERAHVTFDRRTGGRPTPGCTSTPSHPDDIVMVDGLAVTSGPDGRRHAGGRFEPPSRWRMRATDCRTDAARAAVARILVATRRRLARHGCTTADCWSCGGARRRAPGEGVARPGRAAGRGS